MKKAIKAVKKASESSDWNKQELLLLAYSAIDKAQRRNIIHKKNAARKKSRLSALVS